MLNQPTLEQTEQATVVLRRRWKGVACVQRVPQAIHRALQQAALLVAGSKLWVEVSEFLETPTPARGLLVLVGALLLLALLLSPRTAPPPTDLVD